VKYARFEALMISLGALVIFGSLLMGPPLNQLGFWQEGLGQVLIIVVLAAAVHWGRDGGSVTAFAATLVYVLTRIPLLSQQGLTKNILAMIVTRVLIYAIVGILGGEIFGRVKYIVAQLEGSSTLDDFTQVYNRRYCGQALKNGLGQFQRYQVPFSIAVISLAPGLFTDLRPSRQRTFLRNVANHVRDPAADTRIGCSGGERSYPERSPGPGRSERRIRDGDTARGSRRRCRHVRPRAIARPRGRHTNRRSVRAGGDGDRLVRDVQRLRIDHNDSRVREHDARTLGIVDPEDVDGCCSARLDEAVGVLDIEPVLAENPKDVRETTGPIRHLDGDDVRDRRAESGAFERRDCTTRTIADDANDAELRRIGHHERPHVDTRITKNPRQFRKPT
jgi:hypothetical protein